MKKVQLSKEEQEILDDFENGNFISSDNFALDKKMQK